MDFLVHSLASPSASAGSDELNERHWSYMDRFAAGMTARGPTLGPDRETWTGSMHVVSLPSLDDVRSFVDDEPYNLAARFESHRTWLFTNLLGRTMWDLERRPHEPYFLVLSPRGLDLPDERLLMHGSLETLDGVPAGYAAAVQLPDRTAFDGVDAEVHDWEPGGRR